MTRTPPLSSLRGVCNLYKLKPSAAEIGSLFAMTADHGLNLAEEVLSRLPGLVIADGRVRSMTWGFPLVLKGKQGQPLKSKPVTNAREDKLHTGCWRPSFERRRCLIPVSAWAEAEGEKGRMTRTWYSLAGDQPFAVAGLWRTTDEWGDAYSMVMVNSCPLMAEVHYRMPVILRETDWLCWLSGTSAEAFDLCNTWLDELAVEPTSEPWVKRAS